MFFFVIDLSLLPVCIVGFCRCFLPGAEDMTELGVLEYIDST